MCKNKTLKIIHEAQLVENCIKMAESKKLTGQHSNFTKSILACEKLLILKRTKATASSLISQMTQAKTELERKKLKIDDLDQTIGQRYQKCTENLDKALTDLDNLLENSASQDDGAAFRSNYRGDKCNSDSSSGDSDNNSDSDDSKESGDSENDDNCSDSSSDSSSNQSSNNDSDDDLSGTSDISENNSSQDDNDESNGSEVNSDSSSRNASGSDSDRNSSGSIEENDHDSESEPDDSYSDGDTCGDASGDATSSD